MSRTVVLEAASGRARTARTTARGLHPADWRLVQRVVVAGGLLGAAAIHGSLAGEHLGEWLAAGVFFLVLEVVQLCLAVRAVFAWDRRTAAMVVVVGGATLALWSVSRTVGMPIGPADFRAPEPVGAADLACGLLELASMAAAAAAMRWMASPQGRVGADSSPTRAGALAGALAAAAALVVTIVGVSPALVATSGGDGHHHVSSRPAG